MPALDPLANLDTWKSIPDAERTAILGALATACGDGWTVGPVRAGRHGLGQLAHRSQGRFVVVPGGWMRMGFSVDDVFLGANLREQRKEDSPWRLATSRPTRWVKIRPFLMAVDGMSASAGEPMTDGGAASIAYREAVKAAKGEAPDEEEEEDDDEEGSDEGARLVPLDELPEVIESIPDGFRLPTEAELEWVLREGGTTRWIGVAGDVEITAATRNQILSGDLENGFGIISFRDIQNPCADGAGWYGGESPTDQRALNTDADERIGRWGHTYWQWDDGEMMGMHAASRGTMDEFGDTIVRLAADLPLRVEALGQPPGALPEHARTLAALAGDDALLRADALAALAQIARGPGHDVAGTAEAVIALLPKLASPLRARMLRWLADAQVGGHSEETVEKPERMRPDAFADRAETRAVVARSSSAIGALLDDADPDVRSAAALALAFSPAAAAGAGPLLAARLAREQTVGVRATIVLALARFGAALPAVSDAPELRAAVAIGTAYDSAPDLDALIAATGLDTIPHCTFDHGQLGNVATGLLRRLGTAATRLRAAPNIAARAARESNAGLAGTAIEIAFGEDRTEGAPWAADQLGAEQRRVIEALIEMPGDLPWRAHGLPATPSGRRRLLGLSAGGPSEQMVDHAGARRTIAYALRDLHVRNDDETATALLDALDPATRLALFLDRKTHGLGGPLDDLELPALLESLGDDRIAARAAIDALVTADRPRGGSDLLEAVAATRAPGEPLDRALLADLHDDVFGRDPALLARFPRADVEARLLACVRGKLAEALASDRWSIGADTQMETWAGALACAPSAQAARWMLVVGWASGQPASVREAIGQHGGAAPEIAAVLAEYDAYPDYTSWPQARAALADLMGARP